MEVFGSDIPHNHWVTALTSLPPNVHNQYPNGIIATGCMDTTIRLVDDVGNCIVQCCGHEKGIISFTWTESWDLVSGSWDGTAKVWDITTGHCKRTISGHENGVHVLYIGADVLATVSTGESVNNQPANFRLRYYSLTTGSCLSTIEDHEGPIRSIFRVSNEVIGTTSNDGTLHLRNASSGDTLTTLSHPCSESFPPFILDGTALPDGSVVTCGEDGSVVVWRDGVMNQVIQHPTCVWTLLALPNGEFVTAGHDGKLRRFSPDASKADTGRAVVLQTEFVSAIEEAAARKRSGPSSEEIAKAPRWEDRGSLPGTSEGQVRIFNKNSKAIAAQWASGSWIEVGEVTGSGDGGSLGGAVYDHIIPVEIETPNGIQELKLGYNDTENPFEAAQRFINMHSLNQSYLSQIADFIAARSGRSAPTFDMSSQALAAPTPAFAHIPVRTFCYFEAVPANLETKFLDKVVEFNSGEPNALSDIHVTNLKSLLATLADTSHYHSSRIRSVEVEPVFVMITWSVERQFPVFDLARMILAHEGGTQALAAHCRFPQLIESIITVMSADMSSKNVQTTTLTGIRCLCNCFKFAAAREAFKLVLLGRTSDVFNACRHQTASPSKPARQALSVLLLNMTHLSVRDMTQVMHFGHVLGNAAKIAMSLVSQTDEAADVVYNCLLLFGSMAAAKCLPPETELTSALMRLRGRKMTSDVAACLDEVMLALGSK